MLHGLSNENGTLDFSLNRQLLKPYYFQLTHCSLQGLLCNLG